MFSVLLYLFLTEPLPSKMLFIGLTSPSPWLLPLQALMQPAYLVCSP